MLPARDRARLARDHGLDLPRFSLAVGLLELVVGVVAFVVAGLRFTDAATTDGAMRLLENWRPGLSTTHMQGLGLLNWLAWLVWPASWPFSYLALTGLARCLAFAITRESMGEPAMLPLIALWRRSRVRRERRRRLSELGPWRPDRIVAGREGMLVVLTCREKPDWTDTATIELDGRFYFASPPEERADGAWIVLAYTLYPVSEGAVIRNLVRYAPAGFGAAGGRVPGPPQPSSPP
jgi:hypothetical protein